MLRHELVMLREDLYKRYHINNMAHPTWLELRQYQLMMKKVNAADPFLTRNQPTN